MKNKLLNLIYLTAFTLIVTLKVNAQGGNTSYFQPNVFPLAPNSNAFTKFGNYPVNLYDGLPDISIPLYTVQAGGLTVPIILSYHASGNRIADVASWVGLGWSINTGGSVTRTIMGLPDDNGYLKGDMHRFGTISSTPNNSDLDYFHATIATRGWDNMPDIYSYQIPGFGGKFFFDGNNNYKVSMVPFSSLKITGLPNTGFDVTDDHGNTYALGHNATEITGTPSTGGIPSTNAISSWLLENMISQNRRDTVNFSYGDSHLMHYPDGMMETETVEDAYTGSCNTGYVNPPVTELLNNPSTVSEKQLSNITYKNGRVDFILADSGRRDVGDNEFASQTIRALDTMKISAYNFATKRMEVQKQVVFCKSYFNPGINGARRLKLDSILLLDKAGAVVQHYLFNYNTSINLPGYGSLARDFWGYYNGKTSSTHLIPNMVIPVISPGQGVTSMQIGSTDPTSRNPDSGYMQADILNRIDYPTGGHTTFKYETNQYYDYHNQLQFAGGLRISTISSFDSPASVTPVLTKTYQYDKARPNFITSATGTNTGIFQNSQNYRWWESVSDIDGNPEGATACANKRVRTFYAQPNEDLAPDAIIVAYSQVTEYEGTPGANTGKTVYRYTDGSGDSFQTAARTGIPITYSYFYSRGLLFDKKTFKVNADSTYQVVKDEQNNYTAFSPKDYGAVGLAIGQYVYNDGVLMGDVAYPLMYLPDDNEVMTYPFEYYDIESDDNYLVGTTVTNYDRADTTKFVTTSTYYNYGSDTTHQQIVNTTTVNSKGDTTITKNVYPYNYAPGNPIIDTMVSQHIWADAIEKYDSLKTATGIKAVTGGQLNRYQVDSYGRTVVPASISTLSVSSPLTGFVPSAVDTRVLNSDPRYTQMIGFDLYDLNNNIIQYTPRNSTPVSIIWDYQDDLPVAEVKKALVYDVGYTSFEAGHDGNWFFYGTPVADITAPTGSMCYPLSSGDVISPYFDPVLPHVFSYWSNNGTATVSDGSGTLTGKAMQTVNGWTCYEYQVPAGTDQITLSGTTAIDELRLYPAGAQMTTYAYVPAGLQTTSDAKGESTHYEYDDFQRLLNVKDKNCNIIKHYDYHYVNAPAAPPVFYSAGAQGTFFRDDCGTDSIGSTVTYMVYPHKYMSKLSQSYADSLAIKDVNANGQAYADSLGTCSIIVYLSNDADSIFTYQPCTGDSTGSPVDYYLQQGAFTSTISQQAADSLAKNYIRLHGQAYADSMGACLPNHPVIHYISFSLANSTGLDGQVSFQGNGKSLTFDFPRADTTLQVPEGTYSVTAYINGSYTDHTFTLGIRTPMSSPHPIFYDVAITDGSDDLNLLVY